MEYIKSASYTSDWKGVDYSNEELQVMPDQSLSLQEILDRFVRNEELEIGQDTWYDEDENSMDDLEKISKADLVDKHNYINSLKEIQTKYETEEQARLQKLKDEAYQQALEEARKKAQEEVKKEQKDTLAK